MQRDLAALHNGPNRNRELLAAGIALEASRTMLLAEHPRYAFAKGATVRALWAVWPDPRLELLAGEVVILKSRVVEFCFGHCNRS